MTEKLSHVDERGRAKMVGVGDKPVTHRVCIARGEVRMAAETLACIAEGRIPKGDVLLTARLAGIQAAKTVSRSEADYVITGHCGPKAFRALESAGIKVVTGVDGTVAEAVERLKSGEVVASKAPDVAGHWA